MKLLRIKEFTKIKIQEKMTKNIKRKYELKKVQATLISLRKIKVTVVMP